MLSFKEACRIQTIIAVLEVDLLQRLRDMTREHELPDSQIPKTKKTIKATVAGTPSICIKLLRVREFKRMPFDSSSSHVLSCSVLSLSLFVLIQNNIIITAGLPRLVLANPSE